MTQINEIYKCNICGNITEVIHNGVGTLVCCGQNMELLSDETKAEFAGEKHIPVVQQEGNKVTVKVGSVPHPMTPEHYIERIEIITDHRTYKKFLNPDPARPDEAIAIFEISGKIIKVREYCNLHGLRKA